MQYKFPLEKKIPVFDIWQIGFELQSTIVYYGGREEMK